NVAALSKDAHRMLDGQGKEVMNSAAASMHSIEELSARLNQLLANNQQSLNSGADGLAQLGPTLVELRKTITTLRSVVDRLQDNPGGYLVGQERVKEFTP
ncbi:MAG: MlaD family protein, partial [Enterobacteriaceae bacterium]